MQIEIKITMQWKTLGKVGLDAQGKPVFPRAPSRPGLYRFEFESPNGKREYIGETDTLDRRFQHYRTPGPSQSTNIRLNALIRDTVKAGGAIGVSIICEGAAIVMDGPAQSPRMENKSDRVLLEHAAIYSARDAGVALVNI